MTTIIYKTINSKRTVSCVLSFIFIFFIGMPFLKAQHIPDKNFASAIKSNCSTCITINGDGTGELVQPSAGNLTELELIGRSISDLTGITGFTGLKVANCNFNKLTSLPALPSSLTNLYCFANQLTSLPALPSNLIYVDFCLNKLTSLPTLPNGLTSLYFDADLIPCIPNAGTGLLLYKVSKGYYVFVGLGKNYPKCFNKTNNQIYCPNLSKNIDASCDDGNPNTVNDRVRNDCKCRGDFKSSAISVTCPTDIYVVSTSIYGTVVTWNERGMFSSVDGFCNSSGLDVKRTSGYYSGYPFEPNARIFEEYIVTDACGNKSSCNFFVNTTGVPTNNLTVSKTGINSPAAGEFTLYQNTPNPVENSTLIGFNLPSEQTARLTIINIAGQVMSVKNINGKSGYNEINISKSELNAAGVFFYRLETKDNTATKKMIIQD